MTIEELLNKYFEGKTSGKEEERLRHFFTKGNVPKHLQVYRPMFTYLEQENRKHRLRVRSIYQRNKVKYIAYAMAGLAAGVLLLVGIARMEIMQTPENYVIINGQRYTDTKLAKAKALEALQNVSFTDEDLNELLFQH